MAARWLVLLPHKNKDSFHFSWWMVSVVEKPKRSMDYFLSDKLIVLEER